MRIFLTGASGFIGGHILHALAARGHTVSCLLRPGTGHTVADMQLPGVEVIEGDFNSPHVWLNRVAGHDAVVNTVGIIRETAHASFDVLHRTTPIALFDRAAAAGVAKVVQISALGADQSAESRYHLTKRAADEHLSRCGVPFVILRPSFVYGPGDQSMALFASMAAQPFTCVPGDGQYRIQPMHVDDLVRAVLAALERPDLANLTLDVGGRDAITFNELFDVLARRMGKAKARILPVPWWVMRTVAWTTDVLLAGNGPVTREELRMLGAGNHCDNGPFERAFGFTPVGFHAGVARRPFGETDRLHARVSPLKVPLRLCVAFIWIATGLVSSLVSTDEGYRLLSEIGWEGTLATAALHGSAWFEVLIGCATLIGWRVRLMGAIQLLLMAGFTVILSVQSPHWWLHPFGPLTKNIPIVGATLVMMAMADD